MTGHVTEQRPLAAERLPALRAAKRSLSSVDPLVGLQVFFAAEYFPTLEAAESLPDGTKAVVWTPRPVISIRC